MSKPRYLLPVRLNVGTFPSQIGHDIYDTLKSKKGSNPDSPENKYPQALFAGFLAERVVNGRHHLLALQVLAARGYASGGPDVPK